MKDRTTIYFAVLILVVVGLLAWARAASEPQERVNNNWPGTDITCILGHQNLAMHIHPELTITADGVVESIPANIGLTENCMAEVHTHDASGQLHIETAVRGKTFDIFDFFAVKGESIEREGYTYQMLVNGTPVDPASYTFKDLDQIEIRYTSEGSAPADSAIQSDIDFNLDI